ncbi:hypothetical protein Tco_0477024, partial [Tanacetum coccineum]
MAQSAGRQANMVEVAELRMLRWTCGKTMLDMIPNRVFRAELNVDSIIDKMREGRLRWYGHVKRRPQTSPVRRVEALLVDGSRTRGQECWPITKAQANMVEVAELRMLRWTCG